MTDSRSMREEITHLREEKASVMWVNTLVDPLKESIIKLEKDVVHHCLKGDTLDRIEQTLNTYPKIREEVSSLKFFRTLMLGMFGTVFLLAISAIVAFANVKSNSENNTGKLETLESKIKNSSVEKTDLEQIKQLLISMKKGN